MSKHKKKQRETRNKPEATIAPATPSPQSAASTPAAQAAPERPTPVAAPAPDPAADYLYRSVDTSLQLERDHAQALAAASSRLLIAVAIMSMGTVILLAVILVSPAGRALAPFFKVMAATATVLMAASLVTALITQLSLKWQSPDSPAAIAARLSLLEDTSAARPATRPATQAATQAATRPATQAALRYARTLDQTFRALRRRNRTVQALMLASVICLLAAIAILTVTAVFAIIAA